LKFLGAKIASPRRKFTTTLRLSGWPPRDLHAQTVYGIDGTKVTPTRSNWRRQPFELLLGYRIESSDYAARTGVRVTYEVKGKTYQVTMPSVLAACPPKDNQQKCGDRSMNESGS
jgi:hypothetical protein